MNKTPVILLATLMGSAAAFAQTASTPQPSLDDVSKRLDALEDRITKLEQQKKGPTEDPASAKALDPISMKNRANPEEVARRVVALQLQVPLKKLPWICGT